MATKVGTEKIVRDSSHVYYVGGDGHVYAAGRGKGAKGHKMKISKMAVKREKGYLYFVDKAGYVARTPMKHGRSKMKG